MGPGHVHFWLLFGKLKNMQWHSGTPDTNWDDTLFRAGGHFLQSSHWAAFNIALEKPVFYASGAGWQCLAIIERARSGTRIYCPYGPVATTEAGFAKALEALAQLAHQQRALFVRIEPYTPNNHFALSDYKLKSALKNIQPAQTWVQYLGQSDDELLAQMTPTNRNLYRNAKSKGIHIRSSQEPADIKIFLQMIHDVAAHTGMQPHTDDYYTTMAEVLLPRNAATLYIAEHDTSPVAAAFVFDSPTTRYYAHAGNLLEARKLHAGSPLVTTMMFDAKKRGQDYFDFMGVAPLGEAHHPWAGFSAFKKAFGGDYKAYLGTWELPTHPLYRLYRGVYQAHKQLRFK
jgi:lipid II:glycine glycyltransferase (peptidoglycan interpeptide bridge formation enzyme)